jgi:hypothetical protein
MTYQIQARIDGIWAAEHVGDIGANEFESFAVASAVLD